MITDDLARLRMMFSPHFLKKNYSVSSSHEVQYGDVVIPHLLVVVTMTLAYTLPLLLVITAVDWMIDKRLHVTSPNSCCTSEARVASLNNDGRQCRQ